MTTERELPAEVVAAIRANRKIEAIKLLRAERGVGLKEAKEAVEAYAAGLPPGHGLQLREEGTGGRLVWIILLCAVAFAVYQFIA